MPTADERLQMFLTLLTEQLDSEPCSAVVIENFVTMGYMSKYGLETVELVGAVKTIAWQRKLPLVRQAPGVRLPFERQAMALFKARKQTQYTDHEVSALSHLLCYEAQAERERRASEGTDLLNEHASPSQPTGIARITYKTRSRQ